MIVKKLGSDNERGQHKAAERLVVHEAGSVGRLNAAKVYERDEEALRRAGCVVNEPFDALPHRHLEGMVKRRVSEGGRWGMAELNREKVLDEVSEDMQG